MAAIGGGSLRRHAMELLEKLNEIDEGELMANLFFAEESSHALPEETKRGHSEYFEEIAQGKVTPLIRKAEEVIFSLKGEEKDLQEALLKKVKSLTDLVMNLLNFSYFS